MKEKAYILTSLKIKSYHLQVPTLISLHITERHVSNLSTHFLALNLLHCLHCYIDGYSQLYV